MESSESLLYAGFQHLNLTQIFMASIFLGSAGAIMDLSVDICSAIYEIIQKKNDISRYEVIKSGFATISSVFNNWISFLNKDTVKYCTIPFEDEVYSKYLEAVMDCEITINGYSRTFNMKLKDLLDF